MITKLPHPDGGSEDDDWVASGDAIDIPGIAPVLSEDPPPVPPPVPKGGIGG